MSDLDEFFRCLGLFRSSAWAQNGAICERALRLLPRSFRLDDITARDLQMHIAIGRPSAKYVGWLCSTWMPRWIYKDGKLEYA